MKAWLMQRKCNIRVTFHCISLDRLLGRRTGGSKQGSCSRRQSVPGTSAALGLESNRVLQAPRGQVHLELQTAFSLPGFSGCHWAAPGRGLVLSSVGWQEGGESGVGAAEGRSSLSGGGRRKRQGMQKSTPHVHDAEQRPRVQC